MREAAVLAAGLGAAAALGWAGTVLHGNVRTAGEVAVARLAGQVADTVVAEWERMLRAPQFPVEPAGAVFRWRAGEPLLEGLELRERGPGTSAAPSVFGTLLAEAERRELVERDPGAALELVLEALEKEPDAPLRPEGLLRAIQLSRSLDRSETARAHWELLRDEVDAGDLRDGLPYLALGWLALPRELPAGSPASALFSAQDLERLLLDQDRLRIGPTARPDVDFQLAPALAVLLERLGLDPPPLERRAAAALARLAGALPAVEEDGRWHVLELVGARFLARSSAGTIEGAFLSGEALAHALAARAPLPAGFALDFSGTDEPSGPVVRPRTNLPGSELAFLLRHADPARIQREESGRLALLRAGLFGLALACAGGGFLTARVLRRERRLAELKQAFIAGVSHDLRTPLASILLLAENLESGRAGEENRARYHRALRREAERLRRLVDDVLDFSRLERGHELELELEDLELEPFLAELAEHGRARVEEAGRPFALAPGPLPSSGRLDPVAVRRAVDNLIDNALKHGAGEVRLGWSARSGHLRISVGDDGPGVPAARAEAIFRPFERFSGPNGQAAGHAGGVGLGLAIVRAIARGHGGDARLADVGTGAGATFALDLDLGLELGPDTGTESR